MKNIRWTILAALILAAPTVAHAQAPGAPGAPVGTTTTTTATGPDSGTVDTSASTTTTTITSSPGIEPGTATTVVADDSQTTALANTGGEPFVISMLGLSMAAGAFFLRRRVTN